MVFGYLKYDSRCDIINVMKAQTFTIGELADAAGVTRRAVHFYIQRGLLPRPESKGRGATYSAAHLDRLRQILRLQQAGHSLAAITRLIESQTDAGPLAVHENLAPYAGKKSAPPTVDSTRTAADPVGRIQSQLQIRLRLAEGVELLLDAGKYNPAAEAIIALRTNILHLNIFWEN